MRDELTTNYPNLYDGYVDVWEDNVQKAKLHLLSSKSKYASFYLVIVEGLSNGKVDNLFVVDLQNMNDELSSKIKVHFFQKKPYLALPKRKAFLWCNTEEIHDQQNLTKLPLGFFNSVVKVETAPLQSVSRNTIFYNDASKYGATHPLIIPRGVHTDSVFVAPKVEKTCNSILINCRIHADEVIFEKMSSKNCGKPVEVLTQSKMSNDNFDSLLGDTTQPFSRYYFQEYTPQKQKDKNTIRMFPNAIYSDKRKQKAKKDDLVFQGVTGIVTIYGSIEEKSQRIIFEDSSLSGEVCLTCKHIKMDIANSTLFNAYVETVEPNSLSIKDTIINESYLHVWYPGALQGKITFLSSFVVINDFYADHKSADSQIMTLAFVGSFADIEDVSVLENTTNLYVDRSIIKVNMSAKEFKRLCEKKKECIITNSQIETTDCKLFFSN